MNETLKDYSALSRKNIPPNNMFQLLLHFYLTITVKKLLNF